MAEMDENPYKSPQVEPGSAPPGTSQIRVKSELREWLGLTWADMLVSLAIVAIVAMFYVKDATADAILAVAGVVLALAACPLGMKRDPGVSQFTNAFKFAAYPVYVLLAIGAIIVHYMWFSI